MGCGNSVSREGYQPNSNNNAVSGAEQSGRNAGATNPSGQVHNHAGRGNNLGRQASSSTTTRDTVVETLARNLKRAANNFNEIALGEDALEGISLAILNDSSKQVPIGHATSVAEDIVFLIKHNLKSSSICEKGIVAIKLLCRYGDDVSTSCDYNIARFGAVGACDIVAQALITHRPEVSLAEQACLAIRNLALKPENSVKLGSACACEAVVRAVVTHESNARIVEYGCWAISNLTASIVENNIALGAIGVCDAVVQAIMNHGDNAQVVDHACSAICNVAAFADNNAKLGTSGVCEALSYVFSTHATSAEVVKSACSAVRNIAVNSENNKKLGTSGVCEHLVKAARGHTHNAALSEQCLRAMVNLASGIQDNAAILVENDAFDLISNMMLAHTNDPAVAEYGCWALWNIATSASDVDKRLESVSLCELLVRILRSHESKSNVVEKASGALSKVASHGSNGAKLCDLGVVEVLVPALKTHEFHSGVVFQICQALLELVKADPLSAPRRVIDCSGKNSLKAISDDSSLQASIRGVADELLQLLRKV